MNCKGIMFFTQKQSLKKSACLDVMRGVELRAWLVQSAPVSHHGVMVAVTVKADKKFCQTAEGQLNVTRYRAIKSIP